MVYRYLYSIYLFPLKQKRFCKGQRDRDAKLSELNLLNMCLFYSILLYNQKLENKVISEICKRKKNVKRREMRDIT